MLILRSKKLLLLVSPCDFWDENRYIYRCSNPNPSHSRFSPNSILPLSIAAAPTPSPPRLLLLAYCCCCWSLQLLLPCCSFDHIVYCSDNGSKPPKCC
ncbi:hypothetical protein L1987_23654 [Smallanthus sonchifolius]|uniref:Uncharacterized protein n=1 Tax=Smallanthus sonchifolius TaxID=185202 RepID=A0ACB9IIA4_9ASTR|nr:hypothetical protein L1987_23654 [Smallanthus sonchifolius]